MAVTHAAGVRNSLANVVGDAHDAGSAGDAVLQLRDGSTVIVEFDLPDPAFDTAPATAAGTITLQGVPIEVQAADDGDVDNFVTRDQDGTIVLSGSVTAVGMGGDIEVTNVNIATGQDCSLESLTYEAAP
jgi:hypothetical protein